MLDVLPGNQLENAARVRCAVGAKICLDQQHLKVFPAGRDEDGLLERGFGFVEMFTGVEIDACQERICLDEPWRKLDRFFRAVPHRLDALGGCIRQRGSRLCVGPFHDIAVVESDHRIFGIRVRGLLQETERLVVFLLPDS